MSSVNLTELQQKFQRFILQEEQDDHEIAPQIRNDSGLAASARLDIYYQAYRIRLRDALADTYEKCLLYLGNDLFASCADTMMARHPSHYRNLRDFGAEFAQVLQDLLPRHQEAAELAHIEWALGLAFDAEDAPWLDRTALHGLTETDWMHTGFQLHPSCHFLRLQTNAPAIWQALAQEQAPPTPEETATTWLVWRKNLQSHFRQLSPSEYAALLAVLDGASFANICAEHASDAQQAAMWLQRWVDDQVFEGLQQG